MNIQTLKNRHRAVREGLSRLKADCLVVTKPASVTYLTGFTGDDSWAIVLPGAVVLVTDSRFTEQAAKDCRLCRIIERKDAMVKVVAKFLRTRREIKAPAIEKSATIADFEGLKKHLHARLRTVSQVIESARRTKDPGEVAAVREAAKIANQALRQTRRKIKPGLTENELAGILDFEIRKSGATNSFETIVAFGPNGSRPHHRPTNRKLRKNDTVLIDFGVRHNSYCCDVTRCFSVGKSGRLFNKVFAAVQEAHAAALKMVKAGVEIKQLDLAAKAVIKKHRLPVYGHGTGHGLGLEVHELPVVSSRTKGTLQAGDVITIEPGVYIPGKLGVRIEDDILVTLNGYTMLSNF